MLRGRSPHARTRIASGLAAVATVAIHALLVKGLLLAEGGRPLIPQHREGLGANAIASDQEPSVTMILVETVDAPSDAAAPDLTASYGKVLENLHLTVIAPVPTLDISTDSLDEQMESTQDSAEASGDRHRRAAMFGLYLAQIEARVERAWLRPRTPSGTQTFECHLQVLQSERGDVREVSLQQCNGDSRWRLSLVQAVERASPLPAPPDPAVFAESLQLSFHSAVFGPGSREGDYEPAREATAQTVTTGQRGQ